MAIIRVNKTKDYTVMSNAHLRDENLSLAAKGLLSVALSLPDDWEYSVEGLCKYCKCGKDKMRSLMKELKDNGYLKIDKTNSPSGTFDYEYVFYETSQPDADLTSMASPDTGKPDMVQPDMVNPPQLNTIEQNTIEQNNSPFNPPKGDKAEKQKKAKNNGSLSTEVLMEEVKTKNFSPAVVSILGEWIEYKKEIKTPYKSATGFQKLLTKLKNEIQKRGEKAVVERIEEAMSRQWVGWNFDTMDAFDKNRPYMQNKQKLETKSRYKDLSQKPDDTEQRKQFQELARNLRESLKNRQE